MNFLLFQTASLYYNLHKVDEQILYIDVRKTHRIEYLVRKNAKKKRKMYYRVQVIAFHPHHWRQWGVRHYSQINGLLHHVYPTTNFHDVHIRYSTWSDQFQIFI